MTEESKKTKNVVLAANTIYEEVLDEEGNPRLDKNNRRIRKRVPGSELRIIQWIDEEGNPLSYTAEIAVAGKRFFAFLNKVDTEVERIKRALENADENTLAKIKNLLGVENAES